MTFNEFVNESSSDFSIANLVREVLLRNKLKIMAASDISDEVFKRVVDKMTQNRPESLDETEIVNDAIVNANLIKPEVEAEEKWNDTVSGTGSTVPQFNDIN